MVGIQSCVPIAQKENLVTARIFLNDICEVIPEDMFALEVSIGIRQLGRSINGKKRDFTGLGIQNQYCNAARKGMKIMNKRE